MSKDKKRLVPVRRFKEFENSAAWEQRKLGNLAEIVRGASPRPISDPKWFDDNSDIGWLRISDVTNQNGRIYYLEQHISKLGQEKTRVITEPHLLLSIAATVGKPLINYIKTGVHDGFLIFLNPKFDLEYMYQWLEMFRPKWNKYGQPGSQVNLNSNLVRKQKIALPSREEQQRISSFLKQLDSLIALHQRKLDKLKRVKSAYLTELFPAEGEREPKRRFPGFTGAWEQRRLGEVGKTQSGIGFPNKEQGGHQGIPFFKVLDMNNEGNEFEMKISNNYVTEIQIANRKWKPISEVPAVIFAKVGAALMLNRKRLVKVPFLIDNNTMAYIFSNEWDPYFGKTLFDTLNLPRYAQIGALPSFNGSDIENIKVMLPSLREQQALSHFFQNINSLITLHQRKLDKLKKMKAAYLNEMFV